MDEYDRFILCSPLIAVGFLFWQVCVFKDNLPFQLCPLLNVMNVMQSYFYYVVLYGSP